MKVYIDYEVLLELIKLRDNMSVGIWNCINKTVGTEVITHRIKQSYLTILGVRDLSFMYKQLSVTVYVDEFPSVNDSLIFELPLIDGKESLFISNISTKSETYHVRSFLAEILEINKLPRHICNYFGSKYNRLGNNCKSCNSYLQCLVKGVDLVI